MNELKAWEKDSDWMKLIVTEIEFSFLYGLSSSLVTILVFIGAMS